MSNTPDDFEGFSGSEAIDPDSAAGRAISPEAVNAEVRHREGAFGEDTSKSDEADIP